MFFSGIRPGSNNITYSFNFRHKPGEIVILTNPPSIRITLNENTSDLLVEKLSKLLKDQNIKI